jgi:hypothetical protein
MHPKEVMALLVEHMPSGVDWQRIILTHRHDPRSGDSITLALPLDMSHQAYEIGQAMTKLGSSLRWPLHLPAPTVVMGEE